MDTIGNIVFFTIEYGDDLEYPFDVWEHYQETRTLINSYNDIQAIYIDFPDAINILTLPYVTARGKTYVGNYLRRLKSQGDIQDFECVSMQNAIALNDFWARYPDGAKVLIDVKSTEGGFATPLHVSYNELLQMSSGPERYDLYRVFEIKEETAQLRIAENVGNFAKGITEVLDKLPQGVLPDGISISPSLLAFQPSLSISFPDEPEEE